MRHGELHESGPWGVMSLEAWVELDRKQPCNDCGCPQDRHDEDEACMECPCVRFRYS